MSSRQVRKRRRDEQPDRERPDADEIAAVLRVLHRVDESLPLKGSVSAAQRLSSIKEASLASLDDLERALRALHAAVFNAQPRGSPNREKAQRLLAAGTSLINYYRLHRERAGSPPSSPFADKGEEPEGPWTVQKSQYLFLINSDGSIQYTGAARKPITASDISSLPPHVKVGTVIPTPSGLVPTNDPSGELTLGADAEKFELPPPPWKPKPLHPVAYLDYGEFSSFAPSMDYEGSDANSHEARLFTKPRRRERDGDASKGANAAKKAAATPAAPAAPTGEAVPPVAAAPAPSTVPNGVKPTANGHEALPDPSDKEAWAREGVDIDLLREMAGDVEDEGTRLVEENAVLLRKLHALQTARLAKSADAAPSKEEVEAAKTLERNLAALAARAEPHQLFSDRSVIEAAAVTLPKYAARDAVFQGTLR